MLLGHWGLLKTRLVGVEFYGCHQKTQKHLSRLRDEVVYGEDKYNMVFKAATQ